MTMPGPMLALLAVLLSSAAAQSIYPVLNITRGQSLPDLPELQADADGWVTLEMTPATLMVSSSCSKLRRGQLALQVDQARRKLRAVAQGPGDNSSTEDPYIVYTGRVYNGKLVSGLIRVQQGTVFTSSVV